MTLKPQSCHRENFTGIKVCLLSRQNLQVFMDREEFHPNPLLPSPQQAITFFPAMMRTHQRGRSRLLEELWMEHKAQTHPGAGSRLPSLCCPQKCSSFPQITHQGLLPATTGRGRCGSCLQERGNQVEIQQKIPSHHGLSFPQNRWAPILREQLKFWLTAPPLSEHSQCLVPDS